MEPIMEAEKGWLMVGEYGCRPKWGILASVAGKERPSLAFGGKKGPKGPKELHIVLGIQLVGRIFACLDENLIYRMDYRFGNI